MCKDVRTVAFHESFHGVDYEVRAISIDGGVEITLPEFEKFETLVEAAGNDRSIDEIRVAAAEEYEKCLVESIQKLKGGIE